MSFHVLPVPVVTVKKSTVRPFITPSKGLCFFSQASFEIFSVFVPCSFTLISDVFVRWDFFYLFCLEICWSSVVSHLPSVLSISLNIIHPPFLLLILQL